MATTTSTTTTTSTPSTAAVAASKRPLTLTLGAVLLLLAAVLIFASPFLPRGRGFVGVGNRPVGTRQPGQGNAQDGVTGQGQPGQGTDQGGFGQGNGQGGANQGAGQGGFGQGNGQGGFGAGRAGAGANVALFRFLTPIRITEGVVGGLFTLLAAWGIWKRKKWGMVMALIAAAVMLLSGAVTVFLPLLGRNVTRALGSLAIVTTFITGAQWEAIIGMIIAVAVAVLVLLPVSQKGYIITPKVRRVM